MMDMDHEYSQMDYLVRMNDKEQSQEADFSDNRHHVSVREYDERTKYEWRAPVSVDNLVEAIEPHFPLTKRLELVTGDAPFKDPKYEHEFMDPEMVYDPVREFRGEDKWSDYRLVQMNFDGMEVIWDDTGMPYEDPRVRVEEWDEDMDGFRKIFPDTVEGDEADEIVNEVEKIV